MRISKGFILLIITLLLMGYYLLCGIYLNNLGYFNQESLFFIEKSKIVFDGFGNRLQVMGLTTPILPFYATFVFSVAKELSIYAPVIASSLGTGILFLIMANVVSQRLNDDFYLFMLIVIFLFHPGILYTACSGKSIYMVLIFFFLFFFNIIKFYYSNTTFHISIASICLVFLVFCDYKFIWLTLFFIPLVLSITIHTLNLGEQESIFRLFMSFNNPALRRKLINKTFAIYIIIFLLPLASVVIYKLLNLTHANDMNYFIESPYANWNVLADRVSFDRATDVVNNTSQQITLLVTISALVFCPMILVALYLFRKNTYHIFTLLTPLAMLEFLQIKYDKVAVGYVYFIMFLILALLCIIFKAKEVRYQLALKIVLAVLVVVQVYTGYLFLKKSSIDDERNFITMLLERKADHAQDQNKDMAEYLSSLPSTEHVLVDDAIAYPIVAFTDSHAIQNLIMPYQETFLTAIETPDKYVDYILLANPKNIVTGYTQLNDRYLQYIRKTLPHLRLQVVYQTDDWTLYKTL